MSYIFYCWEIKDSAQYSSCNQVATYLPIQYLPNARMNKCNEPNDPAVFKRMTPDNWFILFLIPPAAHGKQKTAEKFFHAADVKFIYKCWLWLKIETPEGFSLQYFLFLLLTASIFNKSYRKNSLLSIFKSVFFRLSQITKPTASKKSFLDYFSKFFEIDHKIHTEHSKPSWTIPI